MILYRSTSVISTNEFRETLTIKFYLSDKVMKTYFYVVNICIVFLVIYLQEKGAYLEMNI